MGVPSTKVGRKQVKKATVKLKRLKKRGKMKRHAMDAFEGVIARRTAAARKRALNIEDDWVGDRAVQFANESDEESLPLDMLDADVDWENSAFASKVRRLHLDKEAEEADSVETKRRRFPGAVDENVRQLLPIKVGGKLILRQRAISESENAPQKFDDAERGDKVKEAKDNAEEDLSQEDLSHLTATELLRKRKELLEDAKMRMSTAGFAILAEPQLQFRKLKELLRLCAGEGVHSLIRESVQKLAVTSLAQVFVDIIPGYPIRLHSEDELAQKLKQETKYLYEYEQSLLRYYTKYLQLLEKNAMKLVKSQKKSFDESSFSHKMSVLSVKCLCRMLLGAPHFNFSMNIVSALVQISTSNFDPAVEDCCRCLGDLFHSDVSLRVTAYGARCIAVLVNRKKCAVSPKLLATFLRMNIKEVSRGEKKHEKERIIGKKFKLVKERKAKSRQKYDKQMKKLEADLKEAEAAESSSEKLKNATEAMKHVFATYFRVIKRMQSTSLLEPVLEGLSKFAHLLNVEFFDDIIAALECLVGQKHLRLSDSLHCVHAVFVILSGEGSALNIDPYRFYRTVYRLLPSILFEKQLDVRDHQLETALRSLELMLVSRRRQVPTARVAAFAKRLTALACVLPPHCAAALLAAVRTYFVAHPRIDRLVDTSEDASSSGIFNPLADDPDSCNALSSSLLPELKILSKHSSAPVAHLARHISSGLPNTGVGRISMEIAQRRPYEWLKVESSGVQRNEKADGALPLVPEGLSTFAKRAKQPITSSNLHWLVCKWAEECS